VPKGKPSWVPTRQFRTWPREGGSRLVDFALVNEPAAAVWMVQMNCIDMNAWYSRVDKPDRPDFVLFDLDPPESRNGFVEAIRVAHLIREALERLELRSYVKTSGADGIHVLVPITRRSTYKDTYDFAELVSRRVEAENPGLATTEWLKKKRRGVLVDHRQNGHGKTIASVYSVRPKPGAPVSTPLRWEELGEKVRPRDFGRREALARVEKHGDLFEPVLQGGQALGPMLRALRS
jgi:bifunctional non-homologous end joining protein LigD